MKIETKVESLDDLVACFRSGAIEGKLVELKHVDHGNCLMEDEKDSFAVKPSDAAFVTTAASVLALFVLEVRDSSRIVGSSRREMPLTRSLTTFSSEFRALERTA